MRRLVLIIRFSFIALVFAGVLPRYVFRRLGAGRLDVLGRERLRGEVLADTLERLGATFVKFGQILGTRPDLLGPGYIESLARLQDAVPPVPYEVIEQVLDTELSASERERIVKVEREPIAAASVAQVHGGELEGGERVAIKIQRPAARRQIEGDLAILELGARVLDVIPSIRLLSLPGAVERFGDALRAQLDFRLEADNNRRFAEIFAKTRGVRVPALYEDLCTERVLTMERIDGFKATHAERVKGKARRKVAERGGHAILKMIFEDGFVHADLHPGNILLEEDGTLVFIDLGLVAEIPDELMRPWVDTFTALAERDGHAAARLFYIYAPEVGTKDYAKYEAETEAFFGRFRDKTLGEIEVGEVVGGMMNILRRHRIQVEPVFTVVHVGVLVAEGLGKQLDPDLDLVQMAVPYLISATGRVGEGRPPRREVPASGAR